MRNPPVVTNARLAAAAIAALIGAVAAIGCAPAPPDAEPVALDAEWGGSIEERDGVTYVTNPETGLWDGVDPPPVSFELEQVFGANSEPRDAILGRISGAFVDDSGNVYVYDSQAHALVSFAPDGSVRWRAAQQGEGPGEFQYVHGIGFDGLETIYVLNRSGNQLDLWSLDGRYVDTRPLRNPELGSMYMGGFLSPDRLALMTAVYERVANEYVVVHLGSELGIENRFRVAAEPMIMIPPGFVSQLSHNFQDGLIYMGSEERYRIRVLDGRGVLLRQVSRPVDYLRRAGFASAGDRNTGVDFGGLGAPIVLGSGHWLVYASWPTNVDDPDAFVARTLEPDAPEVEWASSLDLFDSDGRFLLSLVTEGSSVPEIGRPWQVGADGALYTIAADPYPQLRRYRVDIATLR